MMSYTKIDQSIQFGWTTWLPEPKIEISINHNSLATGQYIIYPCARIQVSDPGPYGLLNLALKIVDRLLTMICMITKVNLGVREMGFMFCDLYVPFAGGYKFDKFALFDFCFASWHNRFLEF